MADFDQQQDLRESSSIADLDEENVSKLIDLFRLLDKWARKADGETSVSTQTPAKPSEDLDK